MAKKHYKHASHAARWQNNKRHLVSNDQVIVRDSKSQLIGWPGIVLNTDDLEVIVIHIEGVGKMKFPEKNLQLVDPKF